MLLSLIQIYEIAVQHVGLRHIAIYHQLQVVTDTASGSIDSVLIDYLCHSIPIVLLLV